MQKLKLIWLIISVILPLTCFAAEPLSTNERVLHDSSAGCNNTKGGRWYHTDDKGYTCTLDKVDFATGCCQAGAEQFSCSTCKSDDQCCSSYEHCVSCCMDPKNQPDAGRLESFRGLNKPETGNWDTTFEYCQNKCLTTSRSTQHENAFIGDRRFCFSHLGRPMEDLSALNLPALASDVTVVKAQGGQSCDAVCGQEAYCSLESFTTLNNCNYLLTHFPCEAGCGPNKENAASPGYWNGGTSRENRPAYCTWVNQTAEPVVEGQEVQQLPQFSCSAAIEGFERLCPCKAKTAEEIAAEKKKAEEEAAAEAAAEAEAQKQAQQQQEAGTNQQQQGDGGATTQE